MLNKKGFSLIEILVVVVIGLFILEAAYLLYSGSMKLFKDVKTKSDNLETKMPSIELIGRYIERWGTNVYSTGATTTDCANYPPSDPMCITVTDASPCDQVTYWANLHGTGFVKGVNAGDATKMDIISCRLKDTDPHYIWRGGVLQTVTPVTLAGLSTDNLDCLTANAANATVNKNIMGVALGDLKPGDVIQRAPFKIRLYCAANTADSNNRWLYAEQTDETSSSTPKPSVTEAIAPVDSFQAEILPASSVISGTCIECMTLKVTVNLRSQSKAYMKGGKIESKNLIIERVFGR